jgi:outer membrane usher protein
MRRLFALLFLSLAWHTAAQQSAETIPVPVFLDNEYRGDLSVQVTESEAVLVPASDLLALVQEELSARVMEDASASFRTPEMVRTDAFNALGITVRFDWDQLALVVGVPPLARRTQRLSLIGRSTQPDGIPVPTAGLSLIANLELWSRYAYESAHFQVSATPEVALRFSDITLETQVVVQTGDIPFTLDFVRAVWDIPEVGYRLEAGDLTWLQTNLAGVSRLTGVSLRREPSISQESKQMGAALDRFFLPQAATVEILVNEARLQRRELSAGNYELSGVPLGDGVNRVLVLWRDTETRLAELVIPYDSKLLAPGELDAGVAFAVADRDVLRPVMTLYQQYGVTPEFTIGARQGLEPIELQMDFGLEAVLATAAGTFLFEPDVNIGPQERLVLDLPLRYSFLNSSPSSYLSFGLSAAYQSVTGSAGADAQLVSSGAYVNFALPDGLSVTPRIAYARGLDTGAQDLQLRASIRKSIRGGSSISGEIGFAWDGDPRFFATVTYAAGFPEAQQNLFLQQNLESQEFSAYWARYAGSEAPALDYSLSTRIPVDLAQTMSLSGRLGYAHPLFRGSLSHGLTGVVESGSFRNSTSLSVGSALVVADGVVGLTSPIAGSFALVVPAEQLSGSPFTVSVAGGRETTATGRTVVLPSFRPYAPAQVRVRLPQADRISDQGELEYVISPAYRSGSLVVIAPVVSVSIRGTLVDDDGEPVIYETGRYSGPDDATGSFFTDESGVFEIYGLEPGSYVLRIPELPGTEFRLEAAATDADLLGVGTLTPGPAREPEEPAENEGG